MALQLDKSHTCNFICTPSLRPKSCRTGAALTAGKVCNAKEVKRQDGRANSDVAYITCERMVAMYIPGMLGMDAQVAGMLPFCTCKQPIRW